MTHSFQPYAAEADRFIRDLARELGYPDDEARAYRVLRRAMHAIRRQLSVEESLHLISQLPLLLKGVYADGWTTTGLRADRTHELIALMRAEDRAGYADLPDDAAAHHAFTRVVAALQRYVSPGEMRDVIAQLPQELKVLVLAGVPEAHH